VGCSNATILWHLDAAEWAPSTVSKAESPGSQSDVSFGSRSKIVRRAARGKGVLPPSLHPLICPTGKSVNYLSSPIFKNISVFAAPKSPLYPPPSRPTEGRIRIVRDAGRDAVDAAALGVKRDGRAGSGLSQTRERSTARRRTTLRRTVKSCGSGTRCWCQVGGGFASPTGFGRTVNSPMTVTRRIRRRGERVISRKAIAQGMSDVLR
jgi:hypothetical protein